MDDSAPDAPVAAVVGTKDVCVGQCGLQLARNCTVAGVGQQWLHSLGQHFHLQPQAACLVGHSVSVCCHLAAQQSTAAVAAQTLSARAVLGEVLSHALTRHARGDESSRRGGRGGGRKRRRRSRSEERTESLGKYCDTTRTNVFPLVAFAAPPDEAHQQLKLPFADIDVPHQSHPPLVLRAHHVEPQLHCKLSPLWPRAEAIWTTLLNRRWQRLVAALRAEYQIEFALLLVTGQRVGSEQPCVPVRAGHAALRAAG